MKKITVKKITDLCVRLLLFNGTTMEIAHSVVRELLYNEISGHPSHGLLRLLDYIDEINKQTLLPLAQPSIIKLSNGSYQVNGNRGFGFLSVQSIADALIMGLKEHQISTVSLVNCNHIGRLESIARLISEQGYLMIGFCNFLGAGQKVIPPNGTKARLCTNPIVFSAPLDNKSPIILDMTTSSVAEGKVRNKLYLNENVPDGWLVDNNNNIVNDPSLLYTSPAKAFLTSLGGSSFGYKGFGLGLFSEIFSGVLTGAGYSSSKSSIGGNGGFFIAINPSICGQDTYSVIQNITSLSDYILSSGKDVHLPGHKEYKEIQDTFELTISSFTFDKLIELKNNYEKK